jgi:hypothetical protein
VVTIRGVVSSGAIRVDEKKSADGQSEAARLMSQPRRFGPRPVMVPN